MAAMQGAISAAERSMRSVFVGNIPYEATEEQLKDIFSEVGPVVSFRLVYDRETGKPKGYGFCEYKDQEMALSAMRNLNGFELNGRALRVDNAASEKSKEELKSILLEQIVLRKYKYLQASLGGPPVESPYGPEIDPDKVPDFIAKSVAGLPPEQLYDILKQMKTCLQNNPHEAKTLLLQNPQLAFALLQGLVRMKFVDPQTAATMLHPLENPLPCLADMDPNQPQMTMPAKLQAPPGMPSAASFPQPVIPPNEIPQSVMTAPAIHTAPNMPAPPVNPVMVNQRMPVPQVRAPLLGDRPPPLAEPPRPPVPPNQFADRPMEVMEPYVDPRTLGDRDLRPPPVAGVGDRDLRMPPQGIMIGDKDMRQLGGDQDLRQMPPSAVANNRPFDPRFRGMPGAPDAGRGPGGFDRQRFPGPFDPRTAGFDGRGPPRRVEDPRENQPGGRLPGPAPGPPVMPQASPIAGASPRPSTDLAAAAAAIAPHDQEKAALIMQVLQLSEQQIAMLPAEQRQSIMVLKEQIARNQGH